MGWAERYAKGKENYARSRRIVARSRSLMLAAILGGAGGFGLYSDTAHQINGRPATATLVEHIKSCTVEYQRIGEQKRTEQWPCDRAEEFQKVVGSNKVKISREFIARVQFPLADGRAHEAKVDEFKLNSYKLPVGGTLPVFYAPNNPADVRAEMSWDRIKIQLGLLAVGIVFLVLALGGSFTGLLAWVFRGRTAHAGDETVPVISSQRLVPAAALVPDLGVGMKAPRRNAAAATFNTFPRATGTMGRASFGTRK